MKPANRVELIAREAVREQVALKSDIGIHQQPQGVIRTLPGKDDLTSGGRRVIASGSNLQHAAE